MVYTGYTLLCLYRVTAASLMTRISVWSNGCRTLLKHIDTNQTILYIHSIQAKPQEMLHFICFLGQLSMGLVFGGEK